MRPTYLCSLLFFGSLALPSAQDRVDHSLQKVEFRQGEHEIEVLIGGRPFTTYIVDPSIAKPFFLPLRSARGSIVTRDFPKGNTIPPDHLKDPSLEPHQRSMYFGHGNIDGIDFWGEAAFPSYSDDSVFGRTRLRKIEEARGGANAGSLQAVFSLEDPNGRVIAEEDQAYVFRGTAETRTIDCEITIRANGGSAVTMGDTKEGAFAVRLAQALSAPAGRMVNSEGAEGAAIWGKRADWVDYYGTVDGESLGVAILDHPKSFRHPTYWHARPYGLAAANPFGVREFTNNPAEDGSWTIPQGKTMTFRYRVIIHDGDYRQARIAEAYRAYAAEQ
jgi:Methane oxygenase PmoA